MITAKFGGTSLADAQRIRQAAELIRSDPERRFVVVSAPGKRSSADTKITDHLYRFHASGDPADFQPIEDRDTAIMNRDKRIAEQESKISEQESRITEQAGKITEQADKITEQAGKITEQAGKITEQEERIRSLKGLVQGLLSGGMTIEQIAQMTGQTPEEIRLLL